MRRKFEMGVILMIGQILVTTRCNDDSEEFNYHAVPYPDFYDRNNEIIRMQHPYLRHHPQSPSNGDSGVIESDTVIELRDHPQSHSNRDSRDIESDEVVGHEEKTKVSLFPYLNMTSITMIDRNGKPVVGYFTKPDSPSVARAAFNISAMSFTLYTRKEPKGTIFRNAKDLEATTFDPKNQIKFVTHGWMSEGKADTCIEIKDGYLSNNDVNVIILDWGAISGDAYYVNAVHSVPKVSKYYGVLINDIIKTFAIDPKNIHLIGHSLGAHVSGLVYKQLEGKELGRVTALDPAFPGFDNIVFSNERVSNKSANFVDVIHSCGGLLGILEAVGHADFYPNSGIATQPGCSVLSWYYACSHGRSWKFFADSVAFPERKFRATRCDNWERFIQHECDDSEHIYMGEQVSHKARGKYYLRTNPNPPYPIPEE